MTSKEIIRKVNKAFTTGDAETILSYLTDDVRWDIAGISSHVGKEAFRKEINNDNFVGTPKITVKNEVAEGDYVVVEGEVQCKMKNGGLLDALFLDIYLMKNDKIKELRSYVVPKNDNRLNEIIKT